MREFTFFSGVADRVGEAHSVMRFQPLRGSGGSASPRHVLCVSRRGSLGGPSHRFHRPGGTEYRCRILSASLVLDPCHLALHRLWTLPATATGTEGKPRG